MVRIDQAGIGGPHRVSKSSSVSRASLLGLKILGLLPQLRPRGGYVF